MRTAALVLFAFAAALSGCAAGADAWPPAPVEVRLGEEACAWCRMEVSDGRFAVQARRREAPEQLLVFDDLGCLLSESKKSPIEPQGVFVRRFDGEGWVPATDAIVVKSPEITSPMGSGYAAFATRDAAEKEAALHPGAAVSDLAGLLAGTPRGTR